MIVQEIEEKRGISTMTMRRALVALLFLALLAGTAHATDFPDQIQTNAEKMEWLKRQAEELWKDYRAETAKPLGRQSDARYDAMSAKASDLDTLSMKVPSFRLSLPDPASAKAAHRRAVERLEVVARAPWPEGVKDAVRRGEVRIGMTTEQVALALGRTPTRAEETVTAAGKTETWSFGSALTVHFVNGAVSAIQRAK